MGISPLSSIIYFQQIYWECRGRVGGFTSHVKSPLPQWAGITRQMYMNLPKTHNNDRAHENHANTLSYFGIDFFHTHKKKQGRRRVVNMNFFWSFLEILHAISLIPLENLYRHSPQFDFFFWNNLILKTLC